MPMLLIKYEINFIFFISTNLIEDFPSANFTV